MTRLFAIEDALDSDAWYTPPWVFEGLEITFDLDVASPDGGLPWLPTVAYYTVTDDGLSQPWHGLVWCNPPFSAMGPWCHRWSQHPDGFLLIRPDLSTSGPAAAFAAATSLFVPAGRMRFVSGTGYSGTAHAPNSTSVILGRGPAADAALNRLATRSGGTTRTLGNSE